MNERSDLYKRVLKASDEKFNQKLVVKYLMQITHGRRKKFNKDKAKEELFVCMSKLTLKAINNFFSLIRKAEYPEEKIVHTEDDIMAECYMVLDNCIANSKVEHLKTFGFYYNSALNRAMYRIFNRTYLKYPAISNTNENKEFLFNKKSSGHVDNVAIDLRNFSELEMDIIAFKMSGEKLKDFLQKSEISSVEYYETFENIKTKLKNIYSEELIVLNIKQNG